MKLKKTLTMIAAHAILFTATANADIVIKPMMGVATEDFCSTIPGTWSGKGIVSYGILKCTYTGTAIVTSTADPVQFSMNVSLHKISGACPSDETLILPAVCQNNAIIIKNDEANLSGTFSNNGNSVDLKGTVSIPVTNGGPVVTTNVDSMHLDKQP